MVFTRGYRRNGNGKSRRRRYKRRPMRHMTVGKVKRIISAELKINQDNNDYIQIPLSTPSVIPLTDIVQGDTSMNRSGNWIQPITCHGYVSVRGSNNAVADTNGIRVGIVRWLNDESVDPFDTVKLMSVVGAPAGSFSFINKGSFKVLWSRFINIVNKENNTQFLKTLRWNIKLGRGQKALFDGETTQKKFHIFFFALSDGLSGNEAPEYALDSTLRYTDS